VLPTLTINSDLLSNQWGMVIGIGLVFFLVQLVLCISFYMRVRRQERVVKRLCRDFEDGGSGRNDRRALPRNFAWIHWVISNFPVHTTRRPSNYTREDVLQELDTRISSNGDYLLLQRMGVMAPLLGVVLTVAGFYWLNVGKEDQSLQSILLAVTPLVSGVGTGAVLALINQMLLHIAGRRVESLRMSARTWFDNVIWSHYDGDAKVTVKAVQAMERFVGSINDAAQLFTDNSKLINTSTATMTESALHFREVVRSFAAEIEGVPEALRDVRKTTAASADALEELIGVGSRAVSNLDVSVAAFRTTLDREFAAAATLHRRSSRALAETVQQIASYAKATAQLSEFVAQSIAPTTRQLAEFRETLADLKNIVDAIKNADNAIHSHPGQMRSILEQNDQADHHAASAGSMDRFETRLPGQPR
jgi:hypothetical protein